MKKDPSALWFVLAALLVLSALPSFAAVKLEDVDGLENAALSRRARGLLEANLFVVVPGRHDQMYEVYESCAEDGIPAFVTVDSILHTSHILFDLSLRIIEKEALYPALQDLTDRMLEQSRVQYGEAEDERIREAARLNMGFFSVARRIFDPSAPVESGLEDAVRKEIENIEAHEGFAPRALMSFVKDPDPMRTPYAYEDYSQYVPRGHYTRTEEFKKYFKVMMWYGRSGFALRPGDSPQGVSDGEMMTLQALLMAEAMVRDREAKKLWDGISDATSYFVGDSDDLGPDDYISLVQRIFPETGPVDRFAEPSGLARFIGAALRLRSPVIVSGLAVANGGSAEATVKGFRFMGQRVTPDSRVFQALVYGKKALSYTGRGKPFTMEIVPNAGPVRAFPRGLDLLASLGSKRALEVLEVEGDADYDHYYEQLDAAKEWFYSMSRRDWEKNLYLDTLYALRPLADEAKERNIPAFMRSLAWKDRGLVAALGAWAELKHDTVLYSKQSYTFVASAFEPRPKETPKAYVEPQPEVYARVADAVGDLGRVVERLKLDVGELDAKLEEFGRLLSDLEAISRAELKGGVMSDEENAEMEGIGGTLRRISDLSAGAFGEVTEGKVDSRMDVIADVHTDPNSGQVLEVGVGRPAEILVVVEDKFGPRLARGPVFSYYEFKQPMDDRMTDEKWQAIDDADRPGGQEWTASFAADM